MKILSAQCFCCNQRLPINIETIKYMFEIDLDYLDIKCKYCGRENYIEIGKIEFQQIKDRNIKANKNIPQFKEASLFD